MINPEDIPELAKAISAMKPELTKLIDKMLHSAGLTKDENYEGAYPLAVIVYHTVWPLVKELVNIEHSVYAVLLALYNFLGGIEGDVVKIPSEIANFFKKL